MPPVTDKIRTCVGIWPASACKFVTLKPFKVVRVSSTTGANPDTLLKSTSPPAWGAARLKTSTEIVFVIARLSEEPP